MFNIKIKPTVNVSFYKKALVSGLALLLIATTFNPLYLFS